MTWATKEEYYMRETVKARITRFLHDKGPTTQTTLYSRCGLGLTVEQYWKLIDLMEEEHLIRCDEGTNRHGLVTWIGTE